MKTYEINNQSELEQFKDEYGYKVNGNLDVKCSLNIQKRLYVEGSLSIKAGESIKAGGYIKAGGSIKAGGYIEAGEYIEARGYIEAGEYIEAGGYIKAGGYIEAGWWYIKAGGSIKAGGYIKAGEYIEAGGYIEAGEYIEARGSYGISAGLQITCKDKLTFGLKCFAGICPWRKISDEEKTITCGKFEGGVVEYGILREIGLEDSKVKITCEGKEVEISRESAKALNLI